MRSPARLIVALVLLTIACGCTHQDTARPNHAFQTSTIPTLLEGVYDGDMTLADLRQHGDFGIGTFNDVDGEMVLLDGTFYQIRSDGRVYRPLPETKTPLAVVCRFTPEQDATLNTPLSYEQLRARLDQLRTSANVPCAIRITGDFDLVQTRSVPKQSPPYRRLADVTKDQPTFEFRKTRGTLVAFWFPQYMQGLNVPGYHFHYLTADGNFGGHVLDCRPRLVKVELAELPDLTLRLPRTASFRSATLDQDPHEELHQVEQAPSAPAGR